MTQVFEEVPLHFACRRGDEKLRVKVLFQSAAAS